jgi:hypothetical protein
MINTDRLLDAVDRQVVTWSFLDSFSTAAKAKKYAAKKYVDLQGVLVKSYNPKQWVVIGWARRPS